MTPYVVLPNSITNGTFSAKFYTHMYSTKIRMLTIFGVSFQSIHSIITFGSTRVSNFAIKIFNLLHIK